MDREIAVQSIYGILWPAEILRIIQLFSLILLDLFAVFFDKRNILSGAITICRQFSYIVDAVFDNLETNLGHLRSFELLRMDILCKLGLFFFIFFLPLVYLWINTHAYFFLLYTWDATECDNLSFSLQGRFQIQRGSVTLVPAYHTSSRLLTGPISFFFF